VDSVDRPLTAGAAPLSLRIRRTRAQTGDAPFTLDVAAEIPAGFTIIFGASGSGKSTLLDCIAGLLHPEAGRIALGDEVLLDVDRRIDVPPQKRRIAYVFQSLALFPHMTALENVTYGLADLPESQRAARLVEVVRAFHLEKFAARKPADLSGGERQRVALARSLATSPRLLLLDEPLTALDTGLKKSIIDDLRAWNAAKNIPILYVTHSRAEVDALGERVIVVDHGRIAATGAPLEVLEAPRQSSLAQAAGFENLFIGEVIESRADDGVMRVRLQPGASEIETPLGYAAVGSRVTIAIRAGDIMLATEPPHALSARNIFPGKLISLDQRGAIVVARVAAGRTGSAAGSALILTVHLTPGASRTLHLEAGTPVWLVLKTHSCHVLAD
jgi:molybdate transport system ATP-binding protein